MLSSEILEQQFGETRVVVVRQDSRHRIINTVAVQTDKILELSLVTFDQNTIAFPDIHKRIFDGASMGSAFAAAGVAFVRTARTVTRTVLPPSLQSYFTDQSPATVVDVDIYVGGDAVHYCHILEIYSPAVTWPQPITATGHSQIQRDLEHFSTLLET